MIINYQNKVAINENPSIADINKVKAEDMNEIKNAFNTQVGPGWYNMPVNVTLTYSSYDSTNHIGVLNSNVDLTPYLEVGTKLKFNNIGVAKYGIIIAITNSSVTIFLGTQSISEGAIESLFYSIVDMPFGFPQYMSSLDKLYLQVEIPVGVFEVSNGVFKPLYRKVIYIGSLGNNGTKTVSHNISNLGIIVRSEFNWLDGNTYWWSDYRWDSASVYIKFNVTASDIRIESIGTDWASRTSNCYAVLEYTKTTD